MPFTLDNKSNSSRFGSSFDSSTFVNLLKGIAGGVASDPFIGLGLRALPGVDKNDVRRFRRFGGTGTAGKIGRAVGEIGTFLAPGAVALKAGQRAGRFALSAAGKRFGTLGAVDLEGGTILGATKAARGIEGATARLEAGAGARFRERLGREAFEEDLKRRGLDVAISPAKALEKGFITESEQTLIKDILGTAKTTTIRSTKGKGGISGTRVLTRSAEVIGGNLGFSAFDLVREGLDTVFTGDSYDDALRHASLSLLLGVGLEGGVTFIGRLQRIRPDLGLTNLLTDSFKRKIGIKIGSKDIRLINPETGVSNLQDRGIHNPLGFAPRELSQRELKPKFANQAAAARAGGAPEQKRELKLLQSNLLESLNKVLTVSGSVMLSNGGKARLVPGEITLRQFKKIKSVADLEKKLASHFRLATKGGKPVKKNIQRKLGVEKLIRIREDIDSQVKTLDVILQGNPLTPYFDNVPIATSGMQHTMQSLFLQAVVSPKSFVSRLGVTASRLLKAQDAVGIKTLQSRDLAVSLGQDFQTTVMKTLGFTSKSLRKKNRQATFGTMMKIISGSENFADPNLMAQEFVRTITKANGARITLEEAKQLVVVRLEMEDIMVNGLTRKLNLLRTKGGSFNQSDAKLLQGFKDLRAKDPRLKEIDAKNIGNIPGVNGMFFPHLMKNLPQSQLDDFIVAAMDEAERGVYFATRGGTAERTHSKLFASFDYNRSIPGTLEDKIARGMPFEENPFVAFTRYMYELNSKFHTGESLGHTPKQQEKLLKLVKDIVARENAFVPANSATGLPQPNAAAAQLMGDIYSVFLGKKAETEGNRKIASLFTSFNIASKLTFAVIPNMGQTTQTITFNGFRNTMRASRVFFKSESKEAVMIGTGNAEGLLDHNVHAFTDRSFVEPGMGSVLANFMQDVAEGTLRFTQFTRVESFNRTLSAQAAFNRAVEITTKAAAMNSSGKQFLIGKQLEAARRHARSLGFDLDEVAKRIRAGGTRTGPDGQEVIKWFESQQGIEWTLRTLFKGAQQTQFVPSALNKPIWWDTPGGRVVFQFKTFALQQAKFMRDAVLRELAEGNPNPALHFMGIAPVAGELVGDLKQWIKGSEREDTGIGRVFNNILNVGGAGIISDTWRAMQFEQGLESLAGPTFSDLIGVIEQASRGNLSGIGRDISRQPIVQATGAAVRGGAFLGNELVEAGRSLSKVIYSAGAPTIEWSDRYNEVVSDFNEGPKGTTTVGGLLQQDIAKKRR